MPFRNIVSFSCHKIGKKIIFSDEIMAFFYCYCLMALSCFEDANG
jgi:hypothetical protein